jgi:hypothetical protein
LENIGEKWVGIKNQKIRKGKKKEHERTSFFVFCVEWSKESGSPTVGPYRRYFRAVWIRPLGEDFSHKKNITSVQPRGLIRWVLTH